MHSRFISPRNDPDSPRRRLRLFSMNNERPTRKQTSNSSLVSKTRTPAEPRLNTNDAAVRKSPGSLRPKSSLSPRKNAPASLAPQNNMCDALAAPPLSRPPPPPLSRNSNSSSRPGVSFQRNDDAVAAKVSTFDRPMPEASMQPNIRPFDPVAAKIASFDNPSRQTPAMPNHDPIAAKIAAHDNQRSMPMQPGSSDNSEVTYMEIAPGERVRLRGARETWQCVENDFYLPTTCFSCDTDLCCIMDASYVLCPLCKVVSPVEGWAGGPDGGVGLGFTYTDLANWQQEIMQRRQPMAGY